MRNIAVNAIINRKEQPASLYVHGSIMTYRMDDTVIVSKASPQGINPSILLLNLKINEGRGPNKGTPKSFIFETPEELIKLYKQVTIRYGINSYITVNIEFFG